jgi:hypothetical protein
LPAICRLCFPDDTVAIRLFSASTLQYNKGIVTERIAVAALNTVFWNCQKPNRVFTVGAFGFLFFQERQTGFSESICLTRERQNED